MDPIPNLMEAAREGNINGLYEAIKKNPTLLKEIDEIPFVNSPLHEAASAGQTNFVTVMIDLAPSFARKLNPDCLSPLDLAVINNHYDTVKRLVSFDGELVRVKGKDRLTPLHRAAESDDKIGCLIELLLACPDSVEDMTIREETALHIAMKKKNSSAEAFNMLYEWVSRVGDHKQQLQKKDAEGNSAETYHKKQHPKKNKKNSTVLKEMDEIPFINIAMHEAASTGQTNFPLEMISLALSFGRKLNPNGLSLPLLTRAGLVEDLTHGFKMQ